MQSEQIAYVAVELVDPQMRIGLSVDQLSTDAHLVARPPDASFEYIAHAKLATDLFGVDRFVPIGEGGIARDHEAVLNTR